MYNYLVNFLLLLGFGIFFYSRIGMDWKLYILIAAALGHLTVFFIKLKKSQKHTD
ncbi:hypothetical protein [Gramella sp. MAR_2010_147]|uniref:hypothetical protein n=1 Tax=Gramella sp. MAR_2010_147 TaxID=1250205 RepID=UPI0012FE144F|nr:hypothetical protein [Gramella sp. MAR_2010_147]